MPRIRTIKPKTWDDSKLAKVSRDARLTYIAMWNFADDLGVIMADPVWLKSKIFPYDQLQLPQFIKWLDELSKPGFISLFSHNTEEFYYLPNLTKHQVINRPNYEDVFVEKADLEAILAVSLINHGNIIDESRPERKGKECKGKEREEFSPPLFNDVFIFFKENSGWDKKKCTADAQKFINHYGRTDWKTKNGPITNWQNAASGWITTDDEFNIGKEKAKNPTMIKLPEYYDRKFEATLSTQECQQYHSYLVSIGWVAVKAQEGYIANWIKK